MTTKRENILAAIRTALTNTTGVGTRIYRTRVDPVARLECPAIIVQPIRDTCVQTTSLPKLDWTMTIRVTVIERGDIPDQAADDTVESLHSKVMADLSLGGYAIDVRPVRTEFEFMEADKALGLISCEYEIRYRTEVDDLTQ
jgi:hypothetical protein|tara:strand:+ start:794 stop:1219 length:426 start_codon:yes stop_codon:yes gene_type:complete